MLACSCLSCRMSLGSCSCVCVCGQQAGCGCWVPEDEKCKKEGVPAAGCLRETAALEFQKLRTPHTLGSFRVQPYSTPISYIPRA